MKTRFEDTRQQLRLRNLSAGELFVVANSAAQFKDHAHVFEVVKVPNYDEIMVRNLTLACGPCVSDGKIPVLTATPNGPELTEVHSNTVWETPVIRVRPVSVEDGVITYSPV